MRYDISNIIDEYPGVHIGVIVCRGLNNKTSYSQLSRLRTEAMDAARAQMGDGPPTKHPHIASWREMYRSFGTKPADYRPSAENLIRRAMKTGELHQINTAVDLYNDRSIEDQILIDLRRQGDHAFQ